MNPPKPSPKCLAASMLLLLCATVALATDNPVDALAGTVLEKSGIRVGICEMPQAGDGALAAALALQGVAQVHALAPDVKAAEAARKPARSSGVMGSQVIIETGRADGLPLGDWVADLYLVADATDAALNSLSASEAGRVLSPYRGVALVGNSAGTKAGLTKAALVEWANGTGGTATITEDASGLWAVVKMPPLKGGDDWSHYWHGPDGNPISMDTAFSGTTYQMQWHDMPMQGDRNYTMVVSAGRMFLASCSLYFENHHLLRPQHPYELTARSLFNAKVLWRRPISARFGEMNSLLVATPDRLYAKEGPDVLVLNPETGLETGRIHATKDPLVVRWITLSDGVLLTLAGPRPFSAKIDQPGPKGESDADRVNRIGLESLKRECSQELAAWDAASGKELWRFKEAAIAQRKLTVAAGKVFLYVNDSYATAVDLKSGKTLWKTDAPAPEKSFVERNIAEGRRGEMEAVATPNVYLIFDRFNQLYAAFNAGDGRQLWNQSGNPKARDWAFPMVIGNDVVPRFGAGLNLLTGEKSDTAMNPLTKLSMGGEADSCGHATALESGLWIGNGICDIKTGKQVVTHLAKAPCGIGFFVADGTELLFPSPCMCSYTWKGMEVIRAAPQRPMREGTRLEQGAVGQTSAVAADAKDWPTYRSDETRKGSSAAIVPAKAGVCWTYLPSRAEAGRGAAGLPEYLQNEIAATQAITVGDRLWFGTAEGAVICLDQKTGAEKWRSWTAGKIKSSPTWAEGRIYAGSADGWVYCFAADTGVLCWRYRVAPEERRITVMGGLSSAWPVWSSVLLHDGVAYAAAGIRGTLEGSTLCALDAKTGAVRWQKFFERSSETNDKGKLVNNSPSGGGEMAWYQGKLWWNCIEVTPMVIDPATGAAKPAMDFPACRNFTNIPGVDIGIMPGGWVTFGGSPPPRGGGGVDASSIWGQYGTPAVMLRTGPDGVAPFDSKAGVPDGYTIPRFWRFAGGPQSDFSRTRVNRQIPIWDAGEVLLPGDFDKKTGRSPLLCRGLIDALNARDNESPLKFQNIEKPSWENMNNLEMRYIERLYSPLDLPEDKRHELLPDDLVKQVIEKKFRLSGQMLLAGNAVIVTAAMNQDYAETDLTNWHAVAVSRTERTVLWDVALPVAPGLNGMSLTRGGDVLIPLIDGRMVCIGGGAAEMPVAAAAPAGTQPGLLSRGYASDALVEGFGSWGPAIFDVMTPVKTGVAPDLSIKQEMTDKGPQVLRMEGYLEVPETGSYRFTRSTDNGSWALWGSFMLFDASGSFVEVGITSSVKLSDPVLLEKGKHPISAVVLQGSKGMNFKMQWEGPGLPRADIPAAALSFQPVQDK